MEDVLEAFEPGGALEGDGAAEATGANTQTASAKLLAREVGILSSLRHPNIIRYYESFIENRTLFIIMELVDGTTLLDFINSHKEKNTFLSEERIWQIFCQVCLG